LAPLPGPIWQLARGACWRCPFAGAYIVLAGVAVVAMGLMALMRFPAHSRLPTPAVANGGRPMAVIMRQPVFAVATASAALGYGVMNLLMAATPLAMQQCGLGFDDAALVLQWHVIGMFAPGFSPAADQTLWCAVRHGRWRAAEPGVHCHCPDRRRTAPVCRGAVPARRWLEFVCSPAAPPCHWAPTDPKKKTAPRRPSTSACFGHGTDLVRLRRLGHDPRLVLAERGLTATGVAGWSCVAVAGSTPPQLKHLLPTEAGGRQWVLRR
jgi:hypothetical protein